MLQDKADRLHHTIVDPGHESVLPERICRAAKPHPADGIQHLVRSRHVPGPPPTLPSNILLLGVDEEAKGLSRRLVFLRETYFAKPIQEAGGHIG